LIELIISKEAQAPELVKTLLSRTKTEVKNDREKQGIIGLLETVLLSKFSQLSRQEIETMFFVNDIKQTRVYQEAKQEGIEEGRQEGRQEGKKDAATNLLLRILSKRFRKLGDGYTQNIKSLNIEQLEKLGEALLDFTDVNDLETWLKSEIDV
jgi:predicted transposase YdaD